MARVAISGARRPGVPQSLRNLGGTVAEAISCIVLEDDPQRVAALARAPATRRSCSSWRVRYP